MSYLDYVEGHIYISIQVLSVGGKESQVKDRKVISRFSKPVSSSVSSLTVKSPKKSGITVVQYISRDV